MSEMSTLASQCTVSYTHLNISEKIEQINNEMDQVKNQVVHNKKNNENVQQKELVNLKEQIELSLIHI